MFSKSWLWGSGVYYRPCMVYEKERESFPLPSPWCVHFARCEHCVPFPCQAERQRAAAAASGVGAPHRAIQCLKASRRGLLLCLLNSFSRQPLRPPETRSRSSPFVCAISPCALEKKRRKKKKEINLCWRTLGFQSQTFGESWNQ